MKKIMEIIKNNKMKLIVLVLVIALLIVIGVIRVKEKKKEYSLTQVNQHNYYQLSQEEKYGVIDKNGNVVIEATYENVRIPNPEKAVFICEQNGEIIVLNEKKEKIFTEYEEVTPIQLNGVVSNIPYEKSVLRYKENNKYGLIDFDGKKITAPIYEEINGLEGKESELVVTKNEKQGVINQKGAKIIKEEYDGIVADGYYTEQSKYAKSGYIVTNKTSNGYRFGYISYKLEKILDVEYNEINRIQVEPEADEIYLIASKNGKFGVQKSKKTIINFSYQGIDYNNESKVFEVQRNFKTGVFDIYGNEIIPVEFDEISLNGEYLQAVKGENSTYYDILGNEITDLKYTGLININDDYFITINNENLYGIINKQKEEIIQSKYKYLEHLFNEYFIASDIEGKLGIIDINDKTIAEFKYDVLQKIENTNIVQGKILKDSLSDLYSNKLELVNTSKDTAIYKEENYVVIYSTKEPTLYMDLDGNTLTSKEIFNNNKLFPVEESGKWGYENKSGELIVEYKYDKTTEFNEYGYAGIKQGDKWGVIDKEARVIVEPTYEIEENNRDPEFLGEYYKVYYGYGEIYYTK